MVVLATEGIDLFKITNLSLSRWVPNFKLGSATAPGKLPFCSQLVRAPLVATLEYHPLVKSYARGDIATQFARAYRLPIPKHAPYPPISSIFWSFEHEFY